jgi:hypothetical protein
VKRAGNALLAIAIVGLSLWAAMAAYFGPLGSVLGAALIGGAGLVAAVSAIRSRGSRIPIAVFGVVAVGFLFVWSGIEPSNDRNWQPDVARLASATIDGDRVTLHNIRNFEYRSELDYTPHYYDKTFDLRELDEVDLIAVYWMGDAIAHIMLSFGFAGRDYVTMSIETRKEVGESYDTIRGFFRQYELVYVVGDERDLIGLRTHYRKDPPEDVYLYRTKASAENARRLFLDYLREINTLNEKPAFYNTGTTNCTTNIYRHTKVNPGPHRFSWKILLSGYAPEYVYENGNLDTRMPFADLRRLSHINPVAEAAGFGPDFSQRIRANLPRP